MEFKSIEKIFGSRFITRYNVKYKTSDGSIKDYEMISRRNDLKTYEDLKNNNAEAVVLIMHDTTGQKILINKEFRMAVGDYAYNFPAGLIDPGEDYKTAAARELWEETGLSLKSIEDVWPMSYSAVGIMNERSIVVIGTADGEFAPSTSAEEEIEAMWITKEEMQKLLKTDEHFAARTQAYCWCWANGNGSDRG
ncbi:MAG: NUDIX hydrolase [Clostridiales bacterium]|nr:NUDIX hydrolase [Clostridiales bacterium]